MLQLHATNNVEAWSLSQQAAQRLNLSKRVKEQRPCRFFRLFCLLDPCRCAIDLLLLDDP